MDRPQTILASGLLAFILGVFPPLATAADTQLLRLATTSSVHNSGLLGQLKNRFEKDTGYRVKLFVVGSGAALRMGRSGLTDAIIAHAPRAERVFMDEGHGAVRLPLMHNDFVLVGPADDPAAIHEISDAALALNRIVARGQVFVSRADESGTHEREKVLWQLSGTDPLGKTWYHESGMSMGDTVRLADRLRAYTLVDRGTWLAMRKDLGLALLATDDARLINAYSVIAVNGGQHPDVNEAAGRAFVEWITSAKILALIGAFEVDGEPLFNPEAVRH